MLGKFLEIIEKIHIKLFGHEMSLEMRKFLGHLSWSFVGLFVSSVVLFFINVLAGRLMGPSEYGNYNFVLTIAYVLSVFVVFGQDMVLIRFVASKKKSEEREKYMSNSFLLSFIVSFLIIISSAFFIEEISGFFNVAKLMIVWAIAYAVVFSFRSLLDSFLRGIYEFKSQAVVKIIESLLTLIVFFAAFVVLKKIGYQYYLISLMCGFLFFCLMFFVNSKIRIWKYDRQLMKKTSDYTKKTLILSMVTIFAASVDKLFVGKYIGVKELGIYSAYLTVSILLVGQLVSVLSNAFFPMINNVKDKSAIIKKIDQLSWKLFFPGILVIFMVSFLLLKLFGSAYDIHFSYLILFALSSFFQLSMSFYKSIAMSEENTYGYYLRYSFISLLVFIGMLIVINLSGGNKLAYLFYAYAVYNAFYLTLTRSSCFERKIKTKKQ